MSLKVFCSYSHNDEPLKDELAKHLTMLERQGVISTWHDRKILPGKEWDQQIKENLNTADIILLLISSDFISSKFCWDVEVNRAIERHDAGEACVIPIILRKVSWQSAPFARLQALPKNALPVKSWIDQDDAFTNVAEGIKVAAEQLTKERQQKQQQAEKLLQQQQAERLRQEREREEYETKLYRYEQALSKAVNAAYPLDEFVHNGLKNFQQSLGLRYEDVASIEQRILATKQAKYERQQQEKIKYQRQQAQLQKQPDRELPKAVSQPPSPPGIQTQTFEFDTATIIVKSGLFGLGKTCEINRSRKRAEFFSENLGNGVVLEMVAIPGDQFLMGSPENEPQRNSNESPQHTVTIQPFFMGKFPVTQSQWAIVAALKKVNIDLDTEPSTLKGANRPVERVSWNDAIEFCARLSNNTGKTYRLPSEAEWEYACRAGTTTPFYFGETITTDLANYDGNHTYGAGAKGEFCEQTTDVGKFSPNPFGLFDMHGNIWEWCQDAWHENYNKAPTDGSPWMSKNNDRLLRGGSWLDNPGGCRSADRYCNERFDRFTRVGFRVVVAAPITA
ncbi:SUMF1/EgtB/PvdO family nonheme iron enzyme [Nostoc sp.]|uniref:SUMF1/EgtB/PvdO family nonheme iron enzyme n=1 Tax=Nostoc sp. TaxID=1180 RepID=UPI002FF4B0B9